MLPRSLLQQKHIAGHNHLTGVYVLSYQGNTNTNLGLGCIRGLMSRESSRGLMSHE